MGKCAGIRFTLKTLTEAEDIVISTLADAGVEGIEIEDKVPLSESRQAADVRRYPSGSPGRMTELHISELLSGGGCRQRSDPCTV